VHNCNYLWKTIEVSDELRITKWLKTAQLLAFGLARVKLWLWMTG
jgi:hypothetical protein